MGGGNPATGHTDGATAGQNSPNKNRAGPLRYKTRPAHPFAPHGRDKTRPARSKWPKLARFTRAGRTLYRCRQQEAAQGELYTACEAKTGLSKTAHPAPLPRRAPEGPEGLDAVPVGGDRARLRRPRAATTPPPPKFRTQFIALIFRDTPKTLQFQRCKFNV